MIPYGRQEISDEDVSAVLEVLRSDFLTQGPAVPAFEAAIKQETGAAHAIAVNSATSALHIACRALGVGAGDVVWTAANTFAASANCARLCGADVDFVDIDVETWNLDPAALAAMLTEAEAQGRLPKVVIPVAFAGRSCDMALIRGLADRYGFAILEDASHAIGGAYAHAPVGSGRFAEISVFSFHPVKIVTSGEGGVAVTNDPKLAQRMRLLRTHGVTRDADLLENESHGPWYYEQIDLGLNYRMTDLQAALGASQMRRLREFVDRRHEIARRYEEILANTPVTRPAPDAPGSRSALHLYPILVDEAERKREVFEGLRGRGVGVNVHYIPVYLHPYYRQLGFEPGHCPRAEDYYARAISLPMFPNLTRDQQDHVVSALKDCL